MMGFDIYRRNELEENLHRWNARLDLLAEGAKQLLANDTPDRIIQSLCERVMAHLGCQVFANFVRDADAPRLRLAAHAGMPEEALEAIGCPFPEVVASDCLHRPGCQRAAICDAATADTASNPLAVFGVRAYSCHPLVYQDRNIGVLSFGTRDRNRFSNEDLDLMRAVADLVAAAVARRQWEQDLERQVAERTAELMAANKELEGFTYAASHDMRAPLGRINTFSALLSKNYRNLLEGDGIMFLDFIQQNAMRLNVLVDDLLAHAHIGRQPLSLQAVDPLATVQAVLHELSEDILQRSADIRIDLPASIKVRSNPQGLSQALRNLVDNALKYSSLATLPVIEIGGCRHRNRCHLWVRDNGIGLDMIYKDRIFDIFQRLHSYSEYPGSGIGLALAKRAVERMEGKIWVESAVGQGATFFLELPLDEA